MSSTENGVGGGSVKELAKTWNVAVAANAAPARSPVKKLYANTNLQIVHKGDPNYKEPPRSPLKTPTGSGQQPGLQNGELKSPGGARSPGVTIAQGDVVRSMREKYEQLAKTGDPPKPFVRRPVKMVETATKAPSRKSSQIEVIDDDVTGRPIVFHSNSVIEERRAESSYNYQQEREEEEEEPEREEEEPEREEEEEPEREEEEEPSTTSYGDYNRYGASSPDQEEFQHNSEPYEPENTFEQPEEHRTNYYEEPEEEEAHEEEVREELHEDAEEEEAAEEANNNNGYEESESYETKEEEPEVHNEEEEKEEQPEEDKLKETDEREEEESAEREAEVEDEPETISEEHGVEADDEDEEKIEEENEDNDE